MSELELILSAEFAAAVEANLHRDPLAVALDSRVPNAAAVATQVKYLRRAREKLTDWYSVRCVFPPRAFEQSSGQAAALHAGASMASLRFDRRCPKLVEGLTNRSLPKGAALSLPKGRVAVDLTCGLGVDSWALSRWFEWVVTVERDPFLAAVARENFRRLGASNILIINDLAENFCRRLASDQSGLSDDLGLDLSRVDLVYVDPDRRSDTGRKLVRIQDCSPDVMTLLTDIQRVTSRFVVKLSPLFDVAEVLRIFGPGTRVEVISVDGECKEILADVAFGVDRPSSVRAVAVGLDETEYSFANDVAHSDWPKIDDPFEPDCYKYLIVPDVALQKSRLAVRYFRKRGVWIDDNNGYGFTVDRPVGVMGKVIDIQRVEPFNPKGLKRRLKAEGVRNPDILKRNFPLSTDELRRTLGLANGKSGGATLRLAFTSSAGGLWQITLD